MKSFKNIFIILFGLLIFATTGCEEKVLDKDPRTSFSENDVWSDIDLVKKYVMNNYNALPRWSIDENWSLNMSSSYADQSFIIFNYGTWVYNSGVIDPSEMGALGSKWENRYDYIRNINIFFNRIEEVEAEEDVKERLKGEMKFLRAWCYADLISLFGGVPLLTDVFELDSDFQVNRDPYQDVVDFIIEELDEAKSMVPATVSSGEFGRVTKGAVQGLKSKVLLYAASKLHDPSTEPSGPLYDYDKANKWQEAADAAKAVLDMEEYSLVQVENWKDYQELFLSNNSEIIFASPSHEKYSRNGEPNIGYVNTPNGYHGWSGNTVIHNFVQEFQMEDGLSVEESPLYDDSPETIYDNREMRFYANVVYQGCTYRGRETEFYLPGGLDSKDGPESWNYARTGYTMRKFQDESVDFKDQNPTNPRILFRLAEFYLNYAEAQWHLENYGEAADAINTIRNRVDLPDVEYSNPQELLEAIRHERHIELAFEEHRFWDVRRWMIADEELNENAMGIAWTKEDEEGNLDPNGELTYEIIQNQERNFKERMYYIPIPLTEINKSDLQQNWKYK
ncbi:MAG: RagB/SusD family nutrient uptake outer membrane protein [Bacteroidales bacterium]